MCLKIELSQPINRNLLLLVHWQSKSPIQACTCACVCVCTRARRYALRPQHTWSSLQRGPLGNVVRRGAPENYNHRWTVRLKCCFSVWLQEFFIWASVCFYRTDHWRHFYFSVLWTVIRNKGLNYWSLKHNTDIITSLLSCFLGCTLPIYCKFDGIKRKLGKTKRDVTWCHNGPQPDLH